MKISINGYSWTELFKTQEAWYMAHVNWAKHRLQSYEDDVRAHKVNFYGTKIFSRQEMKMRFTTDKKNGLSIFWGWKIMHLRFDIFQ